MQRLLLVGSLIDFSSKSVYAQSLARHGLFRGRFDIACFPLQAASVKLGACGCTLPMHLRRSLALRNLARLGQKFPNLRDVPRGAICTSSAKESDWGFRAVCFCRLRRILHEVLPCRGLD